MLYLTKLETCVDKTKKKVRKIHGVEIKNDTFSKIFLKTYYIKYIINQ